MEVYILKKGLSNGLGDGSTSHCAHSSDILFQVQPPLLGPHLSGSDYKAIPVCGHIGSRRRIRGLELSSRETEEAAGRDYACRSIGYDFPDMVGQLSLLRNSLHRAVFQLPKKRNIRQEG